MSVNEGSLQVIDIEVNGKLTYIITIRYRYILTSSASLVVFVIHTISYICESMSNR